METKIVKGYSQMELRSRVKDHCASGDWTELGPVFINNEQNCVTYTTTLCKNPKITVKEILAMPDDFIDELHESLTQYIIERDV